MCSEDRYIVTPAGLRVIARNLLNDQRWLLGWRYISSVHSADESPQQGRNSCPLLRSCFIGPCHVWCLNVFHVVSALQFIGCLCIVCRSYIDSVYRMRSRAVPGFSEM